MNNMKKVALIAVGLVLVLSYITYLTMSAAQITCEVCIEYNGRTECRKATANNQSDAQMSATSTACGLISGGIGEVLACQNTKPKSISCEGR